MISPYKNKKPEKWSEITKKLIGKHPLKSIEITKIVLDCWKDIFCSKIGIKPYFIGQDIFPKPQIMSFLLHELVPLSFENKYPRKWRKERTSGDKDLIYIPNDYFSIEIKASSNPRSIFGNRSYAQESNTSRKSKSGYYLAINFQKFSNKKIKPSISRIRFGWLDHEDWIGQKAATGQQARLNPYVLKNKLIEVYSLE